MTRPHTDGLAQQFTGMVVESLAVKQDFGTATIGCRRCSTGYHPPSGSFEPDALGLGAVEIVDFRPTAAGY